MWATTPMDLIAIPEGARRCSVTTGTLRRWIDRGYIPAYRVGARGVRVSAADLNRLVRPLPGRPPETLAGAVNRVLALAAHLTPDQRDRLYAALAGTD